MSTVRNTPENIWSLINSNNIETAMKILDGIQDGSAWVKNATAVCWMRMGKPEKASAILMDMVYRKNSVILRADAADTTRLNLTTAMLMTGSVDGALTVLNAVKHDITMKEKLYQTIAAWKKQLPIWSRLGILLGMYPTDRPVKLDFAPGQIEVNVKEIMDK